jgi:GntR family transcriptional regulator of arabinose operon
MARQGSATPVYQRIANVLRARIIDIQYDRPVRLATEHHLCQVHNASRDTIRRALAVLEAEGLIQRAPKRGTLTDPAGIAAWRQRRHARQIVVLASHAAAPDVPVRFYGRTLQGILMHGEAAGYSVSIRECRQVSPEGPVEQVLRDPQQVLGLILLDIRDERQIESYVRTGCPVVVVDYWARNPNVDVVAIDCFSEGERAAGFLLGQGHRNLFYLGNIHTFQGERVHEVDADLLLAGFVRGLRSAGVSLPAERICFCRQIVNEVDDVVGQMATLSPRPTAGLIFSSATLRRFIAKLQAYDLACPRDLSLVCKAYVGEDLQAAALRGDAEYMGHRAVELLLSRASGQRTRPERVSLPSELRPGPTVRSLQLG